MAHSQSLKNFRSDLYSYVKNNLYGFSAALLLVYLFFVLTSFSGSLYILSRNDQGRDFFVAQHTIQFREFLSIGPQGFNGFIHNSPAYYYLLSLFLLFQDDFLFLRLVNVDLQILTLIFVYFLVKKAFGSLQGFISVLLLSFSQFTFSNAAFIWQPHIMPPFLYLSFLFLLCSYTKNNYSFLILSIVIFAFTLALHVSVISLIPIYILMIVIILKKQRLKFKHFFYSFGVFFICCATFYFSVFSQIFNTANIPLSFQAIIVQNVNEFTKNLINNLSYLSFEPRSIQAEVLILFLLLTTVAYFLLVKNREKQKAYMIIMLYAVLIQTIANSLLSESKTYYLTSIYPLIPIMLSEVTGTIFRRKIFFPVIPIVIIFILLRHITSNFQSMQIRGSQATAVENSQLSHDVVNALKQEIYKIRNEEKFTNINFFHLKVYSNKENFSSGNDESIIWALLEKNLKTRFVLLDKFNGTNYAIINDSKYFFLICHYYNRLLDINEHCINIFSSQYPNYALTKKIYTEFPLDIYVYKYIK